MSKTQDVRTDSESQRPTHDNVTEHFLSLPDQIHPRKGRTDDPRWAASGGCPAESLQYFLLRWARRMGFGKHY